MFEDLYSPSNDFRIHIEPVLSEDNEWIGEVKLSIGYSEDNILDKDDFEALLTLTHIICSSVPFFSEHPDIMELSKSYMDKEQATEKYETSINSIMNKRFDKDNVVRGNFTKDSNVVHMNFKNRED